MLRKGIIALSAAAGLVGGLLVTGPVTAIGDGGGYAESHEGRDGDGGGRTENLVFVQTNKPLGNTVQVYRRAADGVLTAAGEYETGGLGGATVGPPVDALASQESLVYHDGLLFAVNAGSNTVTVFRVKGDELVKLDVVGSGGLLPVSIGVHDDLVYVLNAGGEGMVQGYELDDDGLEPIEEARRSLGLGNANPPAFGDAPAQVSVDPGGRFVLVSTKSHNTVEVFPIDHDGALGDPVSNTVDGTPFGFTFDREGGVAATQSGTNAVIRLRLDRDGKLVPTSPSVPNGQAATCWVQRVGDFLFAANAGSSTISSYRLDPDGQLELLAGAAAAPGGGTIDMTVSDGFLYVQLAAAGSVHGYAVGEDGSLSLVTTVTGLPQFANGIGMEGIAAT
ncbi:beta-propeller fold lactonase family protein [Micromonosporaceae bacterium B7E4]